MTRLRLATVVAVALVSGCGVLVPMPKAPADDLSGWSRIPLPPDPALTAEATSACGMNDNRPLPFLFQDRRTPHAAVVAFGAGGEYQLCSVSRGTGSAFGVGGAGVGGAPEPVTISTAGGQMGSMAVTLVEGTVTRAAARVQIERADGSTVEGSLGGGRWAAWWPGDVDAVRAVAYDRDGVVIGRGTPPDLGP